MNTLALLLTLAVAVSSTLLIIATSSAGSRGSGSAAYVHDLYEEAFLSGGPARVVDTALTRLHSDGRLAVGGPGIVAVRRNEAHDSVERAVLQELTAAPSGALHTLREAVMRHPAVQEIGDGLAARGLLVAPGESRRRRAWARTLFIGCFLGFPVGIALTISEFVRHDGYTDPPFPFIVKVLPALLTGIVVGLSTAAAANARLTRAGRRAADDYRVASAHLTDPAHAVATLGLRALPDPELQGQLVAAARQRPAGRPRSTSPSSASGTGPAFVPVVWCAGTSPGGGSCGGSTGGGGDSGTGSTCGSGSSCGSSGSSCGGGGGSSCSSGSSCGGGSSCGSSS
ncbi:TIGR04222 domain-containing membrane protein [Streptomyces sp. HB132]|uniref:TIGR04222 domain-containing membrane protein n=1 Tax=Streptomyces sp. HB132 TaxID=767388 RepID=UPI001961D153|nr:TIGR04222 domain-containing membrane protein [Streptomyces sp. HB132]MBM7441183.1 uncharacterized protein (TIGR04222 family) [Streptomyces sp. HB132]